MKCPATSLLVLVILVGSRPQSSFAQAVPQVEKATESQACSDAARAKLGSAAVVLKCVRKVKHQWASGSTRGDKANRCFRPQVLCASIAVRRFTTRNHQLEGGSGRC